MSTSRLAFSLLLFSAALLSVEAASARTRHWKEGHLTKSELLRPNSPANSASLCSLFDSWIFTVETADITYKLLGSAFDLALVPDTNKLKFAIDKNGQVHLQDKKGREANIYLRLFERALKNEGALPPLPVKAKSRNWRPAKLARMQPILFSLNIPWLLSGSPPLCPMGMAVIRGWVFALDSDDLSYEVAHAGNTVLPLTISDQTRIAEEGKNKLWLIDEAGKEWKLKLVKKTANGVAAPQTDKS